jgi:hypothetical protein
MATMSMSREQMMFYLENPDQLSEKNLIELKEILDEYPYFQSAHLLYIRNLANEKNFRFANQLKVSAVHATNRTLLYHLLNSNQKKKNVEEVTVKKTPAEPQVNNGEIKKIENQFIEAAYRLEGEVEADKTLAQLVKDINESAVKNKSDLFTPITLSANEEYPCEEDENPDPGSEDEFITETLAKIYIKQGLYVKAINAFQKLKLKFPEKSIYFAKQIDEVNNLLNK